MALRRTIAALFLSLFAAAGVLAAEDELAPLRALAASESARGNADAGAMVALLDGKQDRDVTVRAMQWLQDAADRGRPEAQFQLAFQYETAPAPDYRRAHEWYRKAAEQGYAMAQSNLATMYLFGKGVPRNADLALEWSQKAAMQGNAVSQARLGAMYAAGDGVAQDSLRAEYWLEQAAGQGYVPAQVHLGTMLLLGQSGAPVNEPKGIFWLTAAAERGHPQARALLDKAAKDGVKGAAAPAQKQ